jgi:hypothetical protein
MFVYPMSFGCQPSCLLCLPENTPEKDSHQEALRDKDEHFVIWTQVQALADRRNAVISSREIER